MLKLFLFFCFIALTFGSYIDENGYCTWWNTNNAGGGYTVPDAVIQDVIFKVDDPFSTNQFDMTPDGKYIVVGANTQNKAYLLVWDESAGEYNKIEIPKPTESLPTRHINNLVGFGMDAEISKDGTKIFIGSDEHVDNYGSRAGAIYYYKHNLDDNSLILQQRIALVTDGVQPSYYYHSHNDHQMGNNVMYNDELNIVGFTIVNRHSMLFAHYDEEKDEYYVNNIGQLMEADHIQTDLPKLHPQPTLDNDSVGSAVDVYCARPSNNYYYLQFSGAWGFRGDFSRDGKTVLISDRYARLVSTAGGYLDYVGLLETYRYNETSGYFEQGEVISWAKPDHGILNGDGFGTGVWSDMSYDASVIIAGSPYTSLVESNARKAGAVNIWRDVDGTYQHQQTIYTTYDMMGTSQPGNEGGYGLGYTVSMSADGNTIIAGVTYEYRNDAHNFAHVWKYDETSSQYTYHRAFYEATPWLFTHLGRNGLIRLTADGEYAVIFSYTGELQVRSTALLEP